MKKSKKKKMKAAVTPYALRVRARCEYWSVGLPVMALVGRRGISRTCSPRAARSPRTARYPRGGVVVPAGCIPHCIRLEDPRELEIEIEIENVGARLRACDTRAPVMASLY